MPMNLDIIAFKSQIHIWDNNKMQIKIKYKKPKSIHDQIIFLSSEYLRHGGKESRKKRVNRLIIIAEAIKDKFLINDLRQIGQRQLKWHDEQLRQSGRSFKTRLEYWYASCNLWTWLGRSGQPKKPFQTHKKV